MKRRGCSQWYGSAGRGKDGEQRRGEDNKRVTRMERRRREAGEKYEQSTCEQGKRLPSIELSLLSIGISSAELSVCKCGSGWDPYCGYGEEQSTM